MKTPSELKAELEAELAELEGRPAPAPAEPMSELDQVKAIFEQSTDWAEQYRAFLTTENSERKACPRCWRRQPISNTKCELCGHCPATWLLSVEPHLKMNKRADIVDDQGNILIPAGLAAGRCLADREDRDWRRRASTIFSVDALKYIVRFFCDPGSVWQVEHAAAVLKLLGEEIPPTRDGEQPDGKLPEPE